MNFEINPCLDSKLIAASADLSPPILSKDSKRDNPVILIIRGPPASGKTSVSLLLRDKFSPAARISVDVLRYFVHPRNFSLELLKAIKLNAARLAVGYAEQGISSIIESAFVSKEIVEEMCSIIRSYGFTPFIFTLVADEETVLSQNLQRELYYQTDQVRLEQLYRDYHWDIGQKIWVKGKEIEEVAADICTHLERSLQDKGCENPEDEEGDRYVLFLRHGQALNHPDIFLSDEEKALSGLGEHQAINISSAITLFDPDAIFCSPFLRTVMTARLACKNLNKRIHMSQGLVERSFPVLYGKTREEIALAFSPKLVEDLSGCSDHIVLPGSETLLDAQQRIVDEMKSILNHASKKILVISHGGPHSWLCCHYLGLDLSHVRQFTLDEGHISLFQFDRRGIFKKIIFLNTTHLSLYRLRSSVGEKQ